MGIFEDKEHLGLTPIDLLRSMKRIEPEHTAFEYNSMNTSVLELVANEVTQRTVAEELSERVWRKIGAQNDTYIGADKYGDSMSSGWMNSTPAQHGPLGNDLHAQRREGRRGAGGPSGVLDIGGQLGQCPGPWESCRRRTRELQA